MRTLSLIGFALCALMVGACDYRATPRFGGLAPASDTAGSITTTPLSVIPNRVQLAIGSSFQLTTDAPFGFETRVQWRSLQPSIAAVTPSGVVTALAAGTATVTARYSFDTTTVAIATVSVIGPNTTSITGAATGSP
jgi:hypothetical protein